MLFLSNVNSNVKKRKHKSKPASKYVGSAKQIIKELRIILLRYFPDLRDQINAAVNDPRRQKSCVYSIDELIFASVFMYLFRCKSRNGFNEQRDYDNFRQNYRKVMKLKAPHMDTANAVLERICPEDLSSIQTYLIKILLYKRVFHKFRLLGKYFVVAIDGTGVFKFNELPYDNCPYKTSKNGKVTYSQSVVEAKMICPNGFCVSLATEWITNEDGLLKQDCEYKATLRLLDKLKKRFTRLPLCVVLDGLFFKKPILKKIKSHLWEFIIVWKDKTRYDLQDKVAVYRTKDEIAYMEYTDFPNKNKRDEYKVEWISKALQDDSMSLYYLRGDKTEISIQREVAPRDTKFIYITSIPINRGNAKELFQTGRRRWMIENEGFNYQKNTDLTLHHKMNRNNIGAIKNYYTCLQIAHLLSQLLTLAKQSIAKTFGTTKEVWSILLHYLKLISNYQPDKLKPRYNLRY